MKWSSQGCQSPASALKNCSCRSSWHVEERRLQPRPQPRTAPSGLRCAAHDPCVQPGSVGLQSTGWQPGLLPPRWKRGRQGERGGRERRPVQVREEHFPRVRLCVPSEPVRAGCRATKWIRSFALRARTGRQAATGGEELRPVTGRQAPTSQFRGSAQGGGGPKSRVLRSPLQAGGSGGLSLAGFRVS